MKHSEDRLSEAKEDYLETVLMLSNNGENPVRLVDIAREHKVSKATVSNALSKLGESGFIEYEKYRPVTLTPKGEKLARGTLEKHRMLIDFLTNSLGVTMSEARDAACKMEHAIGADIARKLGEFMRKLSSSRSSSKSSEPTSAGGAKSARSARKNRSKTGK